MRIMGVDPGTLVTGYGVIDVDGGRMSLVEYDVVRTAPSWSLDRRLKAIHLGLLEAIERTSPLEFAIESAFYSKNVQSTLKLGHARGVAILAASLRDLTTAEYAPREVKLAVTGNGNASKEQVEYMVMSMLDLTEQHRFLDATDALAIAICHAGRRERPRGRKKGWSEFIAANPDRVRA